MRGERSNVPRDSAALYGAEELHFDKFKEPKRKRKQMADDGVFSSGIMLRVGKTEEIERQFNEG